MPRARVTDFDLANKVYANATVTFYTADASGVKTTTLATLYAAATGTTTLANPQALNAHGRFKQTVYIESRCIAEIDGISFPSHTTGVITPGQTFRVNTTTSELEYSYDGGSSWSGTGFYLFRFRGAWLTSTAYKLLDKVTNGGVLYLCVVEHTSGTFATDLAAAKWVAYPAQPFSDGAALVANASDTTKKVILSASGVTTGTTRTLTAPDQDGTLAVLSRDQSYSKSQTIAESDAGNQSGTYLWNLSTGQNLKITANGALTFGQPSSATLGEFVSARVVQDSTGSRTISFNSTYFKGLTGVTFSTAANSVDMITFRVRDASTPVLECVGFRNAIGA